MTARGFPAVVALLLALCAPAAAAPAEAAGASASAPLAFRIREGDVLNAFHQQGDVAAHLLLSDGTRPRILAAFPAGNSGAGAWFEASGRPVRWTLDAMRAEHARDARGRPLRGVVAEVRLDAARLVVRDAVLGSVRVLRDYQLGTAYPPETGARARLDGDTLAWSRDRLDGEPGYRLALQARDGRIERDGNGRFVLRSTRDGRPIRLRITALTGETPLAPFPGDALFEPSAGTDARSREALRFLAYHEKFLAGSWRFDTYFGRDTLMSLRLLMPALRAEAIESGLASVLERMNPDGEVAHEEDIGEFAVLRRRREGGSGDAPIYDYGMVDDDVMLAPVAAAWLLDDPRGRARAGEFLSRRLPHGGTVGEALARNFGLVLRWAAPFAKAPAPTRLVALKPGRSTGQWRDSERGLAGGRYAYDVNAVFVPAALRAIARFAANERLAARLGDDAAQAFAQAPAWAEIWAREAPPLFSVVLPGGDAREAASAYAKQAGVPARDAAHALAGGRIAFPALSLDAQGRPIPVLHSDVGFALLFGEPAPEALSNLVEAAMRPFPAGLMTPVGMLVANPAYAPAAVQRDFGPGAYHGTVVWSWQQALMAAGLRRQLARSDLSASARAGLEDAQARLWRAIESGRETRTSELWSWQYADGRYRVAPFGQGRGDVDESNAAQLWSTVYLAIPPP